MNPWHKLGVFILATKLGLKQILSERFTLFGSFITYAVIIIVYGHIFHSLTPEDLAAHHVMASELVWYFGITELVLFCSSFSCFRELQHEIQTDQIDMSLLRPCPLWVFRIGEWSGNYIGRFLFLVVPCLSLTGIMAGDFSLTLTQTIGIVASFPIAGLLLVSSYFMIGASCLWLKQAEPVYWIWNKCVFLFGALIWPLAFYPDLLKSIAWLTPFPSILTVPADWAFKSTLEDHIGGVLHQLFWVTVILVITAKISHAVLRRIQNNGEDGLDDVVV